MNQTCVDPHLSATLTKLLNISAASKLCHELGESFCTKYVFQNCTSSSWVFQEPATSFSSATIEQWFYGLLSTFVVCSCAALGACFYPLMKREFFADILVWMVAMGVGCLSGIAIFHLIPQCFEIPSDSPEEVLLYLHKSVVIMSAIYVFYLAERLFKMILETRQKSPADRRLEVPGSATRRFSAQLHIPRYHSTENLEQRVRTSSKQTSLLGVVEEQPESHSGINGTSGLDGACNSHHHHHSDGTTPMPAIAWMILTGDSLCTEQNDEQYLNFSVDGLSIGAAFSVSIFRGLSISLAVFCEELPHELGDMAILINSGLSLRRAVTYNCLTGASCFAGFAIGVLLGSQPEASSWIFAIAGGMFLYISLVNMVPEMIAVVEEASLKSTKRGLVVLFVQNTGFLFGVGLMYVLARFSHHISLE